MLAGAALGTIHHLASNTRWDGPTLQAQIERRAAELSRHGVGHGDRLAIVHGGTPAFFADLLATWRVGASAACLNPASTAHELATVAAFLEPRAVLGDGQRDDLGAIDAPHFVLEGVSPGGTDLPPQPASQDDEALMLFTSGTTGAPKGVVHTFRSLLARTALNRASIGDADLARTLCVLPTHFGHGLIGNALTPLLAGAHLTLAPGAGLQTAAALPQILVDHEITFLSSVPAFWKLVLKVARPPERSALRRVQVGSAPLSAALWEAICTWAGTRNVHNLYGITEAANWIAGASAAEHTPVDGLIGRAWGGALAVRDPSGTLSALGEGELMVRSPSLMRGYHKRPDLTAEVLAGGWYATGDIGRIDATGVARLTGRIRHEINRAGIKIHPEDLDLLLERHDAVQEACAFGIPDAVSGERVGIAVCLQAAGAADEAALRAWCAAHIRAEAVPEAWFVVDEIPKTDRGKINRDRVREHCMGNEPAERDG